MRDEIVLPKVMRLLPEPRMSVQIMLGDDYWYKNCKNEPWEKLPKITFWAPKYKAAYGFCSNRLLVFAFQITPIMAMQVLGLDMSKIVNRVIPLFDLNPDFAEKCLPKGSSGFAQWQLQITKLLGPFARTVSPPIYDFSAVEKILVESDTAVVETLARKLNLSARQFRRVFIANYGISPKQFQMALKIDRLIRQFHPKPWEQDGQKDIPNLFADQSHLIREFKKRIGLTPKQYWAAKLLGDTSIRSLYIDQMNDYLISAPDTEA